MVQQQSAQSSRLLILGGTTEAAALARSALGRFGHRLRVTTALAGRTEEPAPVSGFVRIGGFGGAEGLARYLKREGIDLLIDATLIDAARVHGASNYRVIRDVIIPAALPHVFTGLRLSLQASWTTLIAAELVGAVAGIGHVLIVASLDIYPGMIFYGMAWVALLGAVMTLVLGRLERVAMPWLR